MHLGLEPVIVLRTDVLATETTSVLQLQTTLLIIPILKTNGQVCLIPAVHLRITVKGLTTGHNVKGIDYGDTECGIAST